MADPGAVLEEVQAQGRPEHESELLSATEVDELKAMLNEQAAAFEMGEGVPPDAAAISDDGGLFKRVLVAGDSSEGTPFDGAEVQVRVHASTRSVQASPTRGPAARARAGGRLALKLRQMVRALFH